MTQEKLIRVVVRSPDLHTPPAGAYGSNRETRDDRRSIPTQTLPSPHYETKSPDLRPEPPLEGERSGVRTPPTRTFPLTLYAFTCGSPA